MATIKCAACGRFIQDSDRNCLYCNTPNSEYKEKEFGSFDSFGSSFSTGGFSDYGFKSSFDTPSTPTDFGVGKDFLDIDPYSTTPKETSVPGQVIKPKATERKDDYESSFAKTSLSNYLNSSSPNTFDEEPVVTGSMSRFFEPAVTEDDDDESCASFTPAAPITNPKETYTPSYTQAPPAVRREKLDNYRKANGYGEYATPKKMLDKSVLAKETYSPPRYDYGGGPVDTPDDSSVYGPLDRVPASRRLNSSKQTGVGVIIGFIVSIYVLQLVMKIILLVLF